MSAFRPCWRSWSNPRRPREGGDPVFYYEWAPAFAGATLQRLVFDDLAVLDLHHVNARHVLRAFLAGRALLDEGDVAVDALHLHVPERLRDRLRLGLARLLDRRDDGVHAVPAAEALGEAARIVAALIPFGDEALGDVAVLHRLGEPGREEHEVVGAVRRLARLLDELVG